MNNVENAQQNPHQVEINIHPTSPAGHRPENFNFSPSAPVNFITENCKNSDEDFMNVSQHSGTRVFNEYNDTSCSI